MLILIQAFLQSPAPENIGFYRLAQKYGINLLCMQ